MGSVRVRSQGLRDKGVRSWPSAIL